MRKAGVLQVEVEIEVPFFDVDMMEIVWHGHYVKYLEVARCALLDRLGHNYQQMRASGYGWPVIDLQLRYLRPLVFQQHIRVRVDLIEWEQRLKLNYLITDAATGERLHGPGYALLGNAAEFLDPVFSSGVTIALRSASLAAPLVDRQLRGETVDWEGDFAQPLKAGVDTFRAYVEGWYDGSFQDVIYHEGADPEIRRMICAILAGYAWDTRNPFVKEPQRRLRLLVELCQLHAKAQP